MKTVTFTVPDGFSEDQIEARILRHIPSAANFSFGPNLERDDKVRRDFVPWGRKKIPMNVERNGGIFGKTVGSKGRRQHDGKILYP